jgi:hypothetical protein
LKTLMADNSITFEAASKKSALTSSSRVSFELTRYWPYISPPHAADDPDADKLYRILGRGHLIQSDILIWRESQKSFSKVENGSVVANPTPVRELFACISGKATIRSDRSQSSRYEGSTIGRWRRGRAPHIVVVTAEPVPSRLGSLAWGLGDLDCVYHLSLRALYEAVIRAEAETGSTDGEEELRQLIEYARLRDVSDLFDDLFGDVLHGKL